MTPARLLPAETVWLQTIDGSVNGGRGRGQGAPRIAPGGTSAGTLAAADRRLALAVVTLREAAPDNGFVNARPMAHHRWMPSIEKGAADSLDELVLSGSASFEGGPAWRGDASLDLVGSPTGELARLTVGEVIGGYYRQVAVTWDGGRLLAERGVPVDSAAP